MAIRLSTGSADIRGNKGDCNAKFAAGGNSKVNSQEIFVPLTSAQHHWRKLKHVCREKAKRYVLIYNARI
jgi:hypothetical protein